MGGDDGDDEADSQPAAETQALETETQHQAQRQTQPAAETHSESLRRKRMRKEKDMVVEACVKRTEALEVKNKIAERMLERQEASSVENVLEILSALPEVREWSPLYEAAMELLIDSEGNRKAFITMKTDEAKIRCLKDGCWKMRMVIMMMNLQCYDILRMNQRTFEALCKILAERYGLKETHHIYLEESVAMFLETVGQDKTKRDIAARYQRSLDTWIH
uniref:DUF8040 domain-containing protein n=1 Tax=Brassica oleracea var. oleracea TaxID=109376 RepID=A0A0D3BM96_BRAOL